ncbi:RNA polymerase subunit sigma-70 [Nocardia yamanashiensis]|uniref:RNA polymerase subunit sigma-70 n=1 Tax=Nocardia yamanashiensis TaxID=209247 RepID=UPI001E48B4A1|nr:RNA polymerase subunit sigma-70 [Nocardia yamanashiensis]UGT43365.1 RNA polymerase subunit sigma-70 [Nocardia yamanashiensis]
MTLDCDLAPVRDLGGQLEPFRRELTAHCYRLLGSAFEAEDAVQETLLRAWSRYETFEGRAQLRTWLYRIATNVCLDMAEATQRRARPMDLSEWVTESNPAVRAYAARGGSIQRVRSGDPADLMIERESVRLAFIAALQTLAPRQRAVVIMRDVLAWSAAETAEILDTTIATVTSSLQRSRIKLSRIDYRGHDAARSLDDEQRLLLAKYIEAFEALDISGLIELLRADMAMSVTPRRPIVGQAEPAA